MDTDEFVAIMNAVAGLLGVIIWPVVLLFALIRFSPAIGNFLANLRELAVKGPGFEASATRTIEVAAALGVAVGSHADEDETPRHAEDQARAVADVVSNVMTPAVVKRAHETTILWVDDSPENNRREREAFAMMGFRFVLCMSTAEALERLSERRFDAIISDMSRSGDRSAGYTLLDAVRQRGDLTPFFIYAGSSRFRDEAKRRGAQGATNRADELLQMVVSAVTSG